MQLSQEALEAKKTYYREYRAKNKDKIRQYNRTWNENNKEKRKAYNQAYWDKKANSSKGDNPEAAE